MLLILMMAHDVVVVYVLSHPNKGFTLSLHPINVYLNMRRFQLLTGVRNL